MAQNWRTEVDAGDYFGHQKKQMAVEGRRPVIRKASDLVGPGINQAAVRITDYNSVDATYNGYYSSVAGALNEPAFLSQNYIGFTSMDAELGGVQIAVGLTDSVRYSRTFVRGALDPTFITWGSWSII